MWRSHGTACRILQEWFERSIDKPVSRASIGQKLKPYFDELQNRDKNS
jgi:hypothetical protein